MNSYVWIEPRGVAQAAKEAAAPGSVLKAGGVDVLDHLKEGLWRPERLVNLSRLPALRESRELPAEGDLPARLRLGAGLTLGQLAADDGLRRRFPALCAAAEGAATPQIRALATLGGNLLQRPRCWYYRSLDHECKKKGGPVCFAQDGQSEFHAILDNRVCAMVHPSAAATALLALDAVVVVQGAAGERRLPIAGLFQSPSEQAADVRREHTLAEGEVLTAVELPIAGGDRSVYLKVKQKQSFDWPLAEVALRLRTGATPEARLVLGAAAPIPWRARAAEDILVPLLRRGGALTAAERAQVARAALAGARPLAQNGYKLALFTTLMDRALQQAQQGARP